MKLIQSILEYVGLAKRTEKILDKFPDDPRLLRLLHAGMGMCTEAGEFNDALKRTIFYGKPLDLTNLKEEMGDLMWYIAIGCDAANLDAAEMLADNINKLQVRFPDKFDSVQALNRDLTAERTVLEGTEANAGAEQKKE